MANNVRRSTIRVTFKFLDQYLKSKDSKKLASNLVANRVNTTAISLKYYDTVLLTYYQDETLRLSGSDWWNKSHTRRVINTWSPLKIYSSRSTTKIGVTQLTVKRIYNYFSFYPFEGMHLDTSEILGRSNPLINSVPIEFTERASLIKDLEAAFLANYPLQQGHVVITPRRGWRNWNAAENLSLYKTDKRHSSDCWDSYKIRRTKKFLSLCDQIVERYPIALTNDYSRDWILPKIGFILGARSSAIEVASAYLHLSDRGYKL